MIFRQLMDPVSSTFTYILAARRGGEALIIDPVLERVDRYVQLLGEMDVKLVKAIDTHVHADHITALGALRDRLRCITVMGERAAVDTVSMRVDDGDTIEIEGLSLDVMYTPGHTDDSYSFVMPDRVFTGDTLLIRGTGRTDFQNGDARAQYHSLFDRLLKLPDDTLVYPAHDYKGETVSTIREERKYNPRLQVASEDAYVALMGGLNLPNPKMMDVAVPANVRIGAPQGDDNADWGLSVDRVMNELGQGTAVLIDLREDKERRRDGVIPGSLHVAYTGLEKHLDQAGLLSQLASSAQKRLVFYCAYGERSALAVKLAQEHGLGHIAHMVGGIDAWKKRGAPIETRS